MYYYLVPAKGTGMPNDPFYPDNAYVPNKTQYVGIMPFNGIYLIATSTQLSGLTHLIDSQIQSECIKRGLDHTEVMKWSL